MPYHCGYSLLPAAHSSSYKGNNYIGYPLIIFTFFVFLLMAADFSFAEGLDEHLGATEYEIACMPCHGIDGKGHGHHTHKLKGSPPDLTQISRINGGIFPFKRIVQIVDGRSIISAHHQREMPIWGHRYRAYKEDDDSAKYTDSRADRRINALVKYIETLQK